MKAAEKGHEKVAEALIDLNAELNLQNSLRVKKKKNSSDLYITYLFVLIFLICIYHFTT